jgi:hypothetical protein
MLANTLRSLRTAVLRAPQTVCHSSLAPLTTTTPRAFFATVPAKIPIADIKALRERSGAPMGDCKKALTAAYAEVADADDKVRACVLPTFVCRGPRRRCACCLVSPALASLSLSFFSRTRLIT